MNKEIEVSIKEVFEQAKAQADAEIEDQVKELPPHLQKEFRKFQKRIPELINDRLHMILAALNGLSLTEAIPLLCLTIEGIAESTGQSPTVIIDEMSEMIHRMND